MLDSYVHRALRAFSVEQQCSFVFTPKCASDLAADSLFFTGLGCGEALVTRCGPKDEHTFGNATILRPLKDLLVQEVFELCKIGNIPVSDLESVRAKSLLSVSQDFIGSMQTSFPHCAFSIVGSVSRLALPETKKQCRACLCFFEETNSSNLCHLCATLSAKHRSKCTLEQLSTLF